MSLTITEALAEIKTIGKRMEKKREGLMPYLARYDGMRDPLEKSGGSIAFIETERQSLKDLGTRIVTLRRAIQRANDETVIGLGGISRTISEWLTWRREVAPGQVAVLKQIVNIVASVREKARKDGVNVTAQGQAQQPQDFIVNVDERAILSEIEVMETILGDLDGQLSLKNATVQISE